MILNCQEECDHGRCIFHHQWQCTGDLIHPPSLEASIPDGDTAGIHIEGSGSVRFLGVDTPEKNFSLADSSAQRRLDSSEWEAYLTDPFLPQFGPFDLDTDLAAHLRTRIGVGAGINHRFHGDHADGC